MATRRASTQKSGLKITIATTTTTTSFINLLLALNTSLTGKSNLQIQRVYFHTSFLKRHQLLIAIKPTDMLHLR